MPTNEKELERVKPCPCGHKPQLVEVPSGFSGRMSYIYFFSCDCGRKSRPYFWLDDAIDDWNRRTKYKEPAKK